MESRRAERKTNRANNSKPYGTKPVKKSAQWFSGILGYIIPRKSNEDEDDEGDEQGLPIASSTESSMNEIALPTAPMVLAGPPRSAPQKLAERGMQMDQGLPPPRTPAHSVPLFTPASPTELVKMSPAERLNRIGSFLEAKHGSSLNEMEAMGILALTRDTSPEPQPEFRFSNSPSRSVSRAGTPETNSPFNPFASTSTNTSVASNTPRRMLSKNPNGDLQYNGAGSARPKRNRYASPGFGTSASPSSSSIKIKMSPAKTPVTPEQTHKRRRMEDEANALQSGDATSVPFPAQSPAPPAAHAPIFGRTRQEQGGPRIRTNIVPTKPAIPSPLRQSQTWETPSPQRPGSSPMGPNGTPVYVPPKAATPTHAASFMTSLLHPKDDKPESTKPDVSNPYQESSPVRLPTRKRPARATKAEKIAESEKTKEAEKADKAAAAAKAKELEMSPVAIIEATIPKGSKRARAPAGIDKSVSSSVNGNTNGSDNNGFLSTPTPSAPVRRSPRMLSPPPESKPLPSLNGSNRMRDAPPLTSTPDAKDDEPSSKKQKGHSGHANGITTPKVTVEDVDDDDNDAGSTPILTFSSIPPPPRPIQTNVTQKSSAPSPSPVSSAGSPSSASPGGSQKPFAPREPSKLRFSTQPEIHVDKFTPPKASTSLLGASSVPTAAQTTATETKDPKATALATSLGSLPKYSFASSSKTNYSSSSLAARTAALAATTSSLPTYDFSTPKSVPVQPTKSGFDWSAAGIKAPTQATGGWKCSTCMCDNPASATEKCSVCETAKPNSEPASKPAAPHSGFDWSAAGIKAPTQAVGGWKCSTCMCDNPASAVDKCTVCETRR